MPKLNENLENARLLADFSNLEASAPQGHPTHPDYFRQNHPDFAPKTWWDEPIEASLKDYFQVQEETIGKAVRTFLQERNGQIEESTKATIQDLQNWSATKPTKQWQVTQGYLRQWWGHKFKDDIMSLTSLLNSIFDPSTNFSRIAEWAVRQTYPGGVPEGVTVQLPGRSITSHSTLREGYIPMQAAIVYLFENPWRARSCAECNKRFVAAEPKNKFCGDSCSRVYRNHNQAKWFSNYDKAMRKKYGKSWRRKKYGRRKGSKGGAS